MTLSVQLKSILSKFDFKKVEVVVHALNQTWVDEDGKKYTPSIDDLKSVAEYCLIQVIKNKDKEAVFSIGGFEALKIENQIELRFVVEQKNYISEMF